MTTRHHATCAAWVIPFSHHRPLLARHGVQSVSMIVLHEADVAGVWRPHRSGERKSCLLLPRRAFSALAEELARGARAYGLLFALLPFASHGSSTFHAPHRAMELWSSVGACPARRPVQETAFRFNLFSEGGHPRAVIVTFTVVRAVVVVDGDI